MKFVVYLSVIIIFTIIIYISFAKTFQSFPKSVLITNHFSVTKPRITPLQAVITNNDPLSIEQMRSKKYPGSNLQIKQTLVDGQNYHQYIVSFTSDGLLEFGLLTVPIGVKPKRGWPVVLFNHGYIPPTSYTSTGNYQAYVNSLAQNGYIVFKPDYRGNGNSSGVPIQPYISSSYITDDLNALSSIKQYKDANPNEIGIWGHSMGGNITLHDLVIVKNIKAAVIWAGVVGTESDILTWWNTRIQSGILTGNDLDTSKTITQLVNQKGNAAKNPDYWNSIDPTYYASSITSPVALFVSENDNEVPSSFSNSLQQILKQNNKKVELYIYPGTDHNLTQSFDPAMNQTLMFFNTYLKQ